MILQAELIDGPWDGAREFCLPNDRRLLIHLRDEEDAGEGTWHVYEREGDSCRFIYRPDGVAHV